MHVYYVLYSIIIQLYSSLSARMLIVLIDVSSFTVYTARSSTENVDSY